MSEQHTPKPSPRAMMGRPDTPFPRHWLYYIVLKYALIVVASAIALYVAYQFL